MSRMAHSFVRLTGPVDEVIGAAAAAVKCEWSVSAPPTAISCREFFSPAQFLGF